MHTIILAFVIALAGLVVIAGGALELSTLEAAEGEMLQVSDYLSGIGTIASGLGMLGLSESLRLTVVLSALLPPSRSPKCSASGAPDTTMQGDGFPARISLVHLQGRL